MKKTRQHKISMWLMDDFTDHVDKLRWEPIVEAGYWLSEKLVEGVCLIYGHAVIDDQCGKPEHRYCAYCMNRRPNEPATG